MRNITKSLLSAAVVAAFTLASPVVVAGEGPVSKTVAVKDTGASSRQRVNLGLNKAAIIELPADATDVLVSNPAVVDAIVRTPRRIYILGLSVGQTNAFFFSDSGKQILNLEISVDRDVDALGSILSQHFPNAQIRAESINDNIVLTGIAPSASIAQQAQDVAARYIGKPEKVLNMITVSGREQVMIKVRVAEMQRVISKQLGIDLKALTNIGNVPVAFESTNQFSLLGRALTTGGAQIGATPGNDLEGTVRAMERAGILKLLSEPNLTAISGETANFSAGGEFPVPSGVDDSGQVRVEYKPFGVGLAFTPVVLSEGRISLKVSSEVSELTPEGALTIPGSTVRTSDGNLLTTQGITIPGLRVRRAETTVEMPSGGSMMVAGLLRDDMKQNIDGYPGLKDLPVLGALFRSRDFQLNQTELVVIVSAILVDPVSGRELKAPTDGFVPANDLEASLNGQANSTYRAKPQPKKAGGGYIIE